MNATIHVVWLHGILTKFGIHTFPSIYIYCDNQSTIKICNDLVQKQQIKHIEVHMHYIRELVHSKAITLYYFLKEEKIADIFTNSFTEKRFAYLISILGVNA